MLIFMKKNMIKKLTFSTKIRIFGSVLAMKYIKLKKI